MVERAIAVKLSHGPVFDPRSLLYDVFFNFRPNRPFFGKTVEMMMSAFASLQVMRN